MEIVGNRKIKTLQKETNKKVAKLALFPRLFERAQLHPIVARFVHSNAFVLGLF